MENVKSLKDFKEVKKTKLYVLHLNAILKVISLTIRGLDKFEVYVPVREILIVIRTQKKILESHLAKCNQLLKERDLQK